MKKLSNILLCASAITVFKAILFVLVYVCIKDITLFYIAGIEVFVAGILLVFALILSIVNDIKYKDKPTKITNKDLERMKEILEKYHPLHKNEEKNGR